MKRSLLALGIIFSILFIDQAVKIWVKLNMYMGQHFNVFGLEWFQIYFTENPGMAFGLELGGDYGKLALSLFRIVAVCFIGYYLSILVKSNKSRGLIASIALIFAGAVGNIIDSALYGLIFTGSEHGAAQMVSFGSGYAGFLHGRVVDMLYFPLFEGQYPDWLPLLGGKHYQFFQPIFNIADSSISIGVFMVILFYRKFFNELSPQNEIQQDLAVVEATGMEQIEETETKHVYSNRENNEDTEALEGLDIPLEDEEPK